MNSSASEIILDLQNLTTGRFNAASFQNINWQIKTGETWAITGPTGAGKTTLAEAIKGKYPLREGKINYNFYPEKETSHQAQNHIALVSFSPESAKLNYKNFYYQQRYNSNDSVSIITVREFLLNAGIYAEAELAAVTKLLKISDLLSLEVIKLSNGQTRKMFLAKALLQKPKLLILDNPYVGLDVGTCQDLDHIIKSLITEGIYIILITNQKDIPEYVTNILELQNFRILNKFTRQEYLSFIKNQAKDLKNTDKSSQLFSSQNFLPDFKIAVQFENTNIKYDDKLVLNNINWIVKKGEKWALIGPNGSGKTTLLSLINGDNPQAFANKIILFDKRKGSGESIWDIKKRIGFVSPELHLYFRQNLPARTVAATGFTDTLYLNRKISEAENLLLTVFFTQLHIEHLQEKSFLQLSAGEQRLVLIIRSLVKNPDLLIWDEPFQGLSSDLIAQATKLLNAYAKFGKTIILVSHYDHEIPGWFTNKIYLDNGKINALIHVN